MKLKRKLLAFAAVIGILGTAGGAFAFWRHGGGEHRAEKMKKFIDYRVNGVLDDLSVDDTQRTQINASKDRLIKQAEQVFQSRGELRDSMLAQWNAEKPDAEAIHKLIDDRMDEFRALAHQAADAGLEVHGVLDAKQRAQVAELIADHMKH